MTDAVLSLNAGSSSIKFALFGMGGGADFTKRLHGQMDGLDKAPHLKAQDMAGKTLTDQHWEDGATKTHEARVQALVGWLESHLGGEKLVAVGHRVVHGGRDFTGPVLIDDAVLAKLEALTPLAPLHQPGSLAPIKALMATRPGLPQIACFDTAYHHTMPVVATRFALPLAFEEDGVRRYGFHGLSYEYIASQLRKDVPQLAHGRVIVAHLGNGASLCAMLDGRSVDTTMGFTALDGLVMGTRCGAVDPGVLLYLLQQKGMAPGDLEHLLYDQSGLLGVSGVSSDIRELTASQDLHARDAIDLFVFHVARETAALAASLGGLDGFVFTGGIGEHATEIQDAVCEKLRWMGVTPGRQDDCGTCISAGDSKVQVHVIPTDEEAMIGQHTLQVLSSMGRVER